MGDVAKWVILAAAAITIISLIVAFPIMNYMDVGVYAAAIQTLVQYAGSAFVFARGLINNLLSPWARSAVSGLMLWMVAKWLVTYSLKVLVWVYHYVFK